MISSKMLDQLVEWAAAEPSTEVCGLLTGADRQVDASWPARNCAEDPARSFEIDAATLIAAHQQVRAGGPALIGCYHSHPGGIAQPSQIDAYAADPNGWIWLIIAGSSVTAWRAVANGALFGRFDPVAILPY